MSFTNQLKDWCNTENGPYRRPFAPNIDWESATVFVVGTNPATPMRDQFGTFEEYWRGLTEDPDLFLCRYRAAHSGGTSRSTANAKHLIESLGPLNVLVTNVVWYPVAKKGDIPGKEWEFGSEWLMKLVEHVQPKAMLCHGKDAETFGKKLQPDLDRYRSPSDQAKASSDGMLVFAYPHFSGQGLKKGAKFQPGKDFPVFAESIIEHIQT